MNEQRKYDKIHLDCSSHFPFFSLPIFSFFFVSTFPLQFSYSTFVLEAKHLYYFVVILRIVAYSI